jgi:HD-like signal output (HDOD) protein
MQTEIDKDEAMDILKGVDIPPCPAVAISLMKEAAKPDVDFDKIIRLISGDVGLAAAMLKTANSPFFGLGRKAQSVSTAVTVLGLKNIINIIMGLSLRNSVNAPKLNMERFWERSNYAAIVCERLAKGNQFISREDAYTFGIFHDCGIPILMLKFPDYKETLTAANAEGGTQIEDDAHATNHAIAGYMLARSWGLKNNVAQAIRYHHDPSFFDQNTAGDTVGIQVLMALGVLSEHIVADFLGFPDEAYWNRLGPRALDCVGMSNRELDEKLADIEEELTEMKEIRC